MKISVASIALPIVLGAIALTQPARVEAQSMYSLFVDNIMISPANGQTALSSYLVRFGIFINNFTPTLANFSQWDANFRGSTGALDGLVGGPFNVAGGGNRYGGQFSASNNSLYPAGSQLYMVVYNVAPGAAVSTATHGVLLTHSNWIFNGPTARRNSRGSIIGWWWYYYDVSGAWTATGNMSESNIAGITSTSAFSSPFNTLSLGPSVGAGGAGQVLQISFDMVPEPSAVSLLAVGIGGWIALRRVRSKKD